MTAEERKAIDRRLARIEGQVRGLRRMVEQDAYCSDILQQVSAVDSALSQVSAAVASQHIKHCVLGHDTGEAHHVAKSMTREEVIEELDEVFSRLMRS